MSPDERKPSTILYLIVAVAVTGGAWVIWRPLGAVVAIMLIGKFREITINNSYYWDSPKYAAIFGHVVGLMTALFVRTLAIFAVKSEWPRTGFEILGAMALAYIGYGIRRGDSFRTDAQRLQLITQGAAVITFVVAMVVAVLFTNGWRG